MDNDRSCESCCYAIGEKAPGGMYVCRRYPATVPKTGDMWCGEWRDKDNQKRDWGTWASDVCDLPSDLDVVATTTTTYDYMTARIGDKPPPEMQKKRGRTRKSGT